MASCHRNVCLVNPQTINLMRTTYPLFNCVVLEFSMIRPLQCCTITLFGIIMGHRKILKCISLDLELSWSFSAIE